MVSNLTFEQRLLMLAEDGPRDSRLYRVRATSRTVGTVKITENGVRRFAEYKQHPEDEALCWLAGGDVNFTGTVVTHWQDGGLREPQVWFPSKKQKRAMLEPLCKYLPEPRFSETMVFHLNSGERSGQPTIIRRDKGDR